MQKVNEMTITEENFEQIDKMRDPIENATPLPKQNNSFQGSERKPYFRHQNATFQENRKKIKIFWQKFTFYQFQCQKDNFDPWQMMIDLGLVYEDKDECNIYHYTSWLWKYCQKRIDLIKRRSTTIAKILIQHIIDSEQLTENDF